MKALQMIEYSSLTACSYAALQLVFGWQPTEMTIFFFGLIALFCATVRNINEKQKGDSL